MNLGFNDVFLIVLYVSSSFVFLSSLIFFLLRDVTCVLAGNVVNQMFMLCDVFCKGQNMKE